MLKEAVLNVTSAGAFLLTGAFVETPMQGRDDVYSFFDEEEDPEPDEGDGDEISFEMF